MAKEIENLVAEVRAGTGKGAARAARRENKVPGVVYGAGQEPLAINMNYHVLLKRLKQGRFLSSLFNLQVEGQGDVKVVCRGVQRDVVRDLPTHVDFLRVADDTRVKLFIELNFVNAEASPGLSRGAKLDVVAPELELEVAAGNVPESITIDLTGKKFHDVITIADLVLPEGVKAVAAANAKVATIAVPSGLLIAE